MRKVLLATTALVAMSVTVAQADVSISGGMDYQYTTSDIADDAASVDGNIKMKVVSFGVERHWQQQQVLKPYTLNPHPKLKTQTATL